MEVSPNELPVYIVGALVGLALICNAVNSIIATYHKAKAPEEAQNEQIKKNTEDIEEIKRQIAEDRQKISGQEESTRLSQQALLALLDHGISGNNLEQMKSAKEALRLHLINH